MLNLNSILKLVIPILAWTAIILQFYLIIENRVASILETIIRFFSFFTILTNLLVAFCFTSSLISPKSAVGKFFSRPSVISAVTAYIVLVGVVYQIILRHAWNPQGLQKWVDELLHSVIPALVLIYWILFVSKSELKWKSAFFWALYPLGYLTYILIRAKPSGFYPYPFVNVNELGYRAVFINCAFISIGFILFSLLMIGLGKLSRKS